VTNQVMQPHLVANHALKSSILDWQQQQQQQQQLSYLAVCWPVMGVQLTGPGPPPGIRMCPSVAEEDHLLQEGGGRGEGCPDGVGRRGKRSQEQPMQLGLCAQHLCFCTTVPAAAACSLLGVVVRLMAAAEGALLVSAMDDEFCLLQSGCDVFSLHPTGQLLCSRVFEMIAWVPYLRQASAGMHRCC